MRILVAQNVPRHYPGGMTRLMQFLHEPLQASGHTVEYFCAEDAPPKWNGHLLRRFVFPWLVYWKARRAFKAGHPYDIINVHEPVSAPVAFLKKRVGSRIVVASHGLEHRAWRFAKEEAHRGRSGPPVRSRVLHPTTILSQCRVGLTLADHVLCLNDDDAQYLRAHFGRDRDSITRVFPGAHPAYARRSAGRDYLRSKRLLFAGTWRKNKGIEDLVPAITDLLSRHQEMELHVLGAGIPKAELLSCFPAALHARISLLQTKTDDENAAIMSDADVFVLPSLFEGTPLTLIEAMASGLPVVTTETCGMKDVVEDGRNGLLCPTHSPKALVHAIERLISDCNVRRALGTTAAQDAAEHFTWTNSAEALEQTYEQVLQVDSLSTEKGQKPRILFAIHVGRDGQTAVYKNTRDRARYLEEQGCCCTILTTEDFPWLRMFGARFIPLLYPLALALWLARRSKKFDVTTFHSYAGWAVLLLRRFSPLFRRLRTVVQFHGLEPLYFSRLQKERESLRTPLSWRYRIISGWLMLRLLRGACRRADMVLCLNSQEREFLIENGWTGADRVHVVANPAPVSFFHDRTYRPRATRLLFVGQWLTMKGIPYLVDAFTKLSRDFPDLRLTCAGTLIPAKTVLQDFPPHLRAKVTVIPRFTKSELFELHLNSDLFVFPTLSEGFSLALIEAMASGLPVITTPVGAAADLVQHSSSGILCRLRDSEQLSEAIADLIDDQSTRVRLGRNGQGVAQNYRPEYVWREYAICLNQLVKPEKVSSSLRKHPQTVSAELEQH